jgi:hypothetical protein
MPVGPSGSPPERDGAAVDLWNTWTAIGDPHLQKRPKKGSFSAGRRRMLSLAQTGALLRRGLGHVVGPAPSR